MCRQLAGSSGSISGRTRTCKVLTIDDEPRAAHSQKIGSFCFRSPLYYALILCYNTGAIRKVNKEISYIVYNQYSYRHYYTNKNMPPQDKTEPAAAAAAAEPEQQGASYWDAPPEQKLEGKTLSTMELSMLEQDEHTLERKQEEDQEAAKSNPAGAGTQKRPSYWDWQENIRKSLSNLSLTEMLFQHGKEQQAGGGGGVDNKETATAAAAEGEEVSDDSLEEQPRAPYWFWRNASLKNLSTASLTSLENAAKASDAAGQAANNKPSYWFWRNASLTNMSNVSLDTMEKTSRETDRMQGNKDETSSSTGGSGPISNMQHKLRSSWRKSFQALSSNSLTKLDESSSGVENTSSAWKKSIFNRKNSMTESFREGEEESGAIEF